MRILVLSNAAWNDNNCFGNSFSNIFSGMDNIEIANVFCSSGEPQNKVVNQYFQITEHSLLLNLKNKNIPSGKEIQCQVNKNKEGTDSAIKKIVLFAKANRATIFFLLRNMIWMIGKWKSNELKRFIDDFKPDLLFMPLYHSTYLNDIAQFIKEYTGRPMLGYVSDDIYTLRQFSLSPLFWINRLYIRTKIKKTFKMCHHIYVISDIQKKEYEMYFHKKCKLLWKGACFENKPQIRTVGQPVKLVYTGNIGVGRYKQLAMIGQAIADLNRDGVKVIMDIYTMTTITSNIRKALNIPGAVNLNGGISPDKVKKVQKDADILVHVESFDFKNRLAVHQSFSTKIVDYLSMAKCIFASGPNDVASIDYLLKNDAAVVAISKNEIEDKLRMLIEHKELIEQYGEKAWECGKRNHNIEEIQRGLKLDFEELINESSTN